MGCIWLVRHGETHHSAGQGRYCGVCAATLTARGEAQAAAVARVLATRPLTALYGSDLARAQYTLAPLQRLTGLAPHADPALRELDYGTWEGLSRAEAAARDPELFAAWLADPEQVAPPGGESLQALVARIEPVFRRLCAQHAASEAVVMAHKCVNRVLLCSLFGIPARHYLVIGQDTGAINRLLIEPHRVVIASVNDRCHLTE